MAAAEEKKVAVLVYLTPDQLMRITWLQEKTPASRGYFIRKALDDCYGDVRPPGPEDRP